MRPLKNASRYSGIQVITLFTNYTYAFLAGKNWWRFSSESTQDCGLVALMLLAT
jgi:hypothetical protein